MYGIVSKTRGWYQRYDRDTNTVIWGPEPQGIVWSCARQAQPVLETLQLSVPDFPEDAKVFIIKKENLT